MYGVYDVTTYTPFAWICRISSAQSDCVYGYLHSINASGTPSGSKRLQTYVSEEKRIYVVGQQEKILNKELTSYDLLTKSIPRFIIGFW